MEKNTKVSTLIFKAILEAKKLNESDELQKSLWSVLTDAFKVQIMQDIDLIGQVKEARLKNEKIGIPMHFSSYPKIFTDHGQEKLQEAAEKLAKENREWQEKLRDLDNLPFGGKPLEPHLNMPLYAEIDLARETGVWPDHLLEYKPKDEPKADIKTIAHKLAWQMGREAGLPDSLIKAAIENADKIVGLDEAEVFNNQVKPHPAAGKVLDHFTSMPSAGIAPHLWDVPPHELFRKYDKANKWSGFKGSIRVKIGNTHVLPGGWENKYIGQVITCLYINAQGLGYFRPENGNLCVLPVECFELITDGLLSAQIKVVRPNHELFHQTFKAYEPVVEPERYWYINSFNYGARPLLLEKSDCAILDCVYAD